LHAILLASERGGQCLDDQGDDEHAHQRQYVTDDGRGQRRADIDAHGAQDGYIDTDHAGRYEAYERRYGRDDQDVAREQSGHGIRLGGDDRPFGPRG
jgi:hypothetical protein